MDKLLIENVRCFASRQEVNIAPITVLTGENSSGKSTFLALARLASELRTTPGRANFNREPFFLGSFREIATSGLKPRAEDFSIGARYTLASSSRKQPKRNGSRSCYQQTTKFVEKSAQPVAAETELTVDGYTLWINLGDNQEPVARISHAAHSYEIKSTDIKSHKFRQAFHMGHIIDWDYMAYWLSDFADSQAHKKNHKNKREILRTLSRYIHDFRGRTWRSLPYAIAPIRSKPERTYDPVDVLPKPEGDHVPMLLSRLKHENKEGWEQMTEELNRFGESAGLFKKISIKTLGKSLSDPFQVRINASGPISNITDVGYGVSQVLPIIVETLLYGIRTQQFLLQQPEVHLHPRGQAALASFLLNRMKEAKQQFIIETHSDFFVDRLRIEVAKGNLKPDDLSLLYFERDRRDTKIHRLHVDEQGNIVNPPGSYRDFFMKEEYSLLGL